MKRVIYLLIVVGISTAAIAATSPSQTPPPGPGNDWTQEDWNNSPPMQNGGLQFGGPMRGPQFMPGQAEFQRQMQQRTQDMQRRMQQMQSQAQANRDSSIRQALGVNDTQWAQIKPRLDRIDRLKAEVNASIDPGGSLNTASGFTSGTTPGAGGTSGGWVGGGFGFSGQSGPNGTRYQSWNSTPSGGSVEPTRAGGLCQELDNLLRAPNVPAGQVSQKIAALRQARQQAERQLTQERKDLRALLNFRQEATLIVMGFLD